MNDIASAYDGAELIQKTYNVLEAAKEEVRLRASDECQRAKEWYKARFSGLEAERFPISDRDGGRLTGGIYSEEHTMKKTDTTEFVDDTESLSYNMARTNDDDFHVLGYYATLLELCGDPDVSRIKDAVISAVKAYPYLLRGFSRMTRESAPETPGRFCV